MGEFLESGVKDKFLSDCTAMEDWLYEDGSFTIIHHTITRDLQRIVVCFLLLTCLLNRKCNMCVFNAYVFVCIDVKQAIVEHSHHIHREFAQKSEIKAKLAELTVVGDAALKREYELQHRCEACSSALVSESEHVVLRYCLLCVFVAYTRAFLLLIRALCDT